MADNKTKEPVKVDMGQLIKKPDNKAKVDDRLADVEKLDKNVIVERYKASSQEGLRLAAENKKLQEELIKSQERLGQYQPYEGIFGLLRRDEGAVDVLSKYAKGEFKKEEPSDPFDEPEDISRAIADPESRSGKLLREFMANTMSSVLEKYDTQSSKRTAIERQKADLLRKNPTMTEEDIDVAVERVKSRELSLDDIVWLANRDNVVQSIAEQKEKDQTTQMKEVSKFPDFFGIKTSQPKDDDTGKAMIDALEAEMGKSDIMRNLKVGQ